MYRASFFTELLHCTQQKDLRNGKALHAQILKSASTCLYLANSLVNLYAKCGNLDKARLVFENIPEKDVVSWNCLINGYSQHGPTGSSFVMKLFQRMRAEDTLPNAHTFAGVFTAASNVSDVFGGQQAHALVIKTASFYDVFVGSSLLNMYCKVGLVLEARKVFDKMPERNSVSWATMISGYAMQRMARDALEVFEFMRREEEDENEFALTSVLSALASPEFVNHDDALKTFEQSGGKDSITWSAMITGYAQSGDSHKALKLFLHMHFSGIKPSEFTFVGVINACSDIGAITEGKQVHGYSLKMGYESQIYMMTALVDMYAKCGSVADARKGFDYLREPDIVLWTSMIGGYVQNGNNESALSLYCRMQMEGIIPNELTMASVLKACSSLAALEQGRQIHTHIIKYGFSLEIPIGSALSTMYAKCGSLEDVDLVFRRMPTRDVVSWNVVISGLSQNGRGHEALKLFEEMQLENTKPDDVTFVNILSACSHMGFVEQGRVYFKMMFDKFGIVPRLEHYACMVDILSRAGKLNEAKAFIESATIDHGMCLWRILLGACKNYHNYKLGAYAGEKLMELGSQESSAYVLLSSIYTALGKREDVERVRKIMKLRGVNKEPGCSWIDLKNMTHVFVVGDQMHPHIGEIHGELRMLAKLMEDEGYEPTFELTSLTL
ncbi:hypothetical protein CMV_008129 [Castanea mollissima]|uniref:Pentatricopeptide repeat-containing protein n=1 Tax=Castanea mollissima TaxID=60419 RepID=A0A8J4VS44_9ROSI|nr:hypothetical protein CMV_008129 [Castanea mollissima]